MRISHNKYFVRLDWLTFIRRLKKDYRVKVLHRDEVPQKIKKKNFSYPSVIGETTDNEFIVIMDKISFVDLKKPNNVCEVLSWSEFLTVNLMCIQQNQMFFATFVYHLGNGFQKNKDNSK